MSSITLKTCSVYLGEDPCLLFTWKVMFWILKNFDSHILRQIRKSYRYNLWFCRNLWSMPCCGTLTPIILRTCFIYLGEYPCTQFAQIWEVASLSISMLFEWYIPMWVCIWIIMTKNKVPRKPFEKGLNDNVNTFYVLMTVTSCAFVINLRNCDLNPHKLRQSQIATSQKTLPSQFVICLNLWSMPLYMGSCVLAYTGIIWLVYRCTYIYI